MHGAVPGTGTDGTEAESSNNITIIALLLTGGGQTPSSKHPAQSRAQTTTRVGIDFQNSKSTMTSYIVYRQCQT